jgi:DNA-binding transcriptional regulator YdaS (Cro superfamily)
MRKSDVLLFFKNGSKTARALGITKSAVSQWPDTIPEAMAYRAQAASKGKLKVDPTVYQKNLQQVG